MVFTSKAFTRPWAAASSTLACRLSTLNSLVKSGSVMRSTSPGRTPENFEIQAWRSFKTTILSKEAASGLKWFYERKSPDAAPVEWNQS